MVAVCNGLFKKDLNPGDRCPDGSIATAPPGLGGSDSANQVSGAWNQDATPVSMDRWVSSPGYSENSQPLVQQTMPVFEAQDYFNRIWGMGSVAGASDASKSQLSGMVAALRRYTDSELGTRGQLEDAWNDAVKDASRSGVSVFALLGGATPLGDDDDQGSGGSRGSGGYSGPVTTNALMDEQSAEMLLNGLATDMLGRNLTKKELAKYTAQFRQQELENPTVTTSTQSSQTSVQGMADEDIARTILQDNPAFADNVLKTDVLDMFFNRIGGQNG